VKMDTRTRFVSFEQIGSVGHPRCDKKSVG
jgi:hypothetical protein